MSFCFGCKGPGVGMMTCERTGQLGFRCFSCGSKGHLSLDDPAVYKDVMGYFVNCPRCGETKAYMGSMSDFSGVAAGLHSGLENPKSPFPWW
jgi:hypothetical protein